MTTPLASFDDLRVKAAITATMNAYTHAGDRGDVEALAATFTSDGVLETLLGTYHTQTGIVAGLRERALPDEHGQVSPRPRFMMHHLTTSTIDITSERTATGRTYFIIYSDNGPDASGVYFDRFRCDDGRWLIEYRNSFLTWVSDAGVNPRQIAAFASRRNTTAADADTPSGAAGPTSAPVR